MAFYNSESIYNVICWNKDTEVGRYMESDTDTEEGTEHDVIIPGSGGCVSTPGAYNLPFSRF